MKKIFSFIRSLLCEHIYGDGEINPFVDEYGQHSAVYTCTKCGHRKFKTFGTKY